MKPIPISARLLIEGNLHNLAFVLCMLAGWIRIGEFFFFTSVMLLGCALHLKFKGR